MKEKDKSPTSQRISRRKFVQRAGGAAAGLAVGSGAITGFPYVIASDPITLRYAGTAVNQHTQIARQR